MENVFLFMFNEKFDVLKKDLSDCCSNAFNYVNLVVYAIG